MTTLHRSKPKRFTALLKQRCPRCLEGSIFTGWVTTREACPVCGLRYGREEGYFSGGMDLSFFLAAPVLAFIFLVLYQFFSSTLTLVATLFLSYAVFLPCAVPLFRYSRVLWLYIDWQLDPVYEVKPAPPPPIVARAWLMPTPNQTVDTRFAICFDAASRHADRSRLRSHLAAPRSRTDRGARAGRVGHGALRLAGRTHAALTRRESFVVVKSFSAYGLPRDQQLSRHRRNTTRQRAEPRVIIEASATADRAGADRSGVGGQPTGLCRCPSNLIRRSNAS